MNLRNIAGIVLVAALGSAVAWCFRQDSSEEQAVSSMTPNTSAATVDDSRGRIVPLVVKDGFSGTAFIRGDDKQPEGSPSRDVASAHHTLRLPVIRRDPLHDTGKETPRLSSAFPHPLRVLGISEDATIAPQLKPLEPSEQPSEVPIKEERSTHIIADGDTLPEIAQQYLGDAARASEIYALNRDKLPSAELLPIGIEIDLPSGT